MRLLIGVLVATALAAGCAKTQQETISSSDVDKDNPYHLIADDEVVMEGTSFGCEFQSEYIEAAQHYLRHERAAWAQIVNDKPSCFNGYELKQNQTFTVLEVDGSTMRIAVTTPKQYDVDPTLYKHRYWTATFWGRHLYDRAIPE